MYDDYQERNDYQKIHFGKMSNLLHRLLETFISLSCQKRGFFLYPLLILKSINLLYKQTKIQKSTL